MSRPRKFNKFGADNTVEDAFGCVNVSIWRGGFTSKVNLVTSNSDSNSIWVFFLWSVADSNLIICDFLFVGFCFGEIKLILFVPFIVIYFPPSVRCDNLLNYPSPHSLASGVFNSLRNSNRSPVDGSRTALRFIMSDMISFRADI